jgi:hypothetical protein
MVMTSWKGHADQVVQVLQHVVQGLLEGLGLAVGLVVTLIAWQSASGWWWPWRLLACAIIFIAVYKLAWGILWVMRFWLGRMMQPRLPPPDPPAPSATPLPRVLDRPRDGILR